MITVLMAAWQGKKYLEQQLDSILAQTVPVRIWVSDDGSDDGTRELLEQYCEWYPKQVFLYSRENSGENGAAGNFFWLLSLAAKEGKSDYVMLSDQDDVWFHHKVKTLLRRGLSDSCSFRYGSDRQPAECTGSQLFPLFSYQSDQKYIWRDSGGKSRNRRRPDDEPGVA